MRLTKLRHSGEPVWFQSQPPRTHAFVRLGKMTFRVTLERARVLGSRQGQIVQRDSTKSGLFLGSDTPGEHLKGGLASRRIVPTCSALPTQ
jgi:hypothetical protein